MTSAKEDNGKSFHNLFAVSHPDLLEWNLEGVWPCGNSVVGFVGRGVLTGGEADTMPAIPLKEIASTNANINIHFSACGFSILWVWLYTITFAAYCI